MDIDILVNRGAETYKLKPEQFDIFNFKTGDRLDVSPPEAVLVTTPDLCKHIRSASGDALRIPPQMEITDFQDFQLQEHLVVLTGMGSHTLDSFGKAHVASYEKHMGLTADMSFLEIGCGIGRDCFQLMNIIGPQGRYVGVDVTREAIRWCQNNITPRRSNFEFYHFDAEHELYNPLGAMTSMDFKLPVEDRSVDRISLGSVFTHLFETEVSHYLHEIGRVLKPTGKAYCSFFLHDPETLDAVVRTNTTPLRFLHPHGDGCFIDNPDYPTGAVAFTDTKMREMIDAANLRLIAPYVQGAWSGRSQDADDGQDVAIVGPK